MISLLQTPYLRYFAGLPCQILVLKAVINILAFVVHYDYYVVYHVLNNHNYANHVAVIFDHMVVYHSIFSYFSCSLAVNCLTELTEISPSNYLWL